MIELSFFERDTVEVAKDLLGCLLVRRMEGGEAVVAITETEAYKGPEDPASHAHRGVTPRNRIMFGRAGKLYVYFSYGMHHCMNIVTEAEGTPGAVLIRGAAAVSGVELLRNNRPGAADKQLMNGPGKLTQALGINLAANGLDLLDPANGELRLLKRPGAPPACEATPRIGISKAKELKWRFILTKP